ncbi:MAG: hypothetical protein Kow0010_03710 [Dehalococcoidia bacterium]
MEIVPAPRPAPNWTTAAGALEGVLAWLGAPLPRHAIMGLTGHAWHACLVERGDVVALPESVVNLDWGAMVSRYERTGVRWERFGARVTSGNRVAAREAALAWARSRLAEGRPIIGFDFHVHEFAIVYGIDDAGEAFLVHSVMSEDMGPRAPLEDWPTATGMIELFAPGDPLEVDAAAAVVDSLRTAMELLDGAGPEDGWPRGTRALEAWADAFAGDVQVDRAGNAYLLAVIQAARLDGAAYLGDVAANFPVVAAELSAAQRALRDEARALAPLLTLFPFPAGGHGNVSNRALRDTAAIALRRAAHHEHEARDSIAMAVRRLEAGRT